MKRKVNNKYKKKKQRKLKTQHKPKGHGEAFWYSLELKTWEWSQIKLAVKQHDKREKKGIKLPSGFPQGDSLTPSSALRSGKALRSVNNDGSIREWKDPSKLNDKHLRNSKGLLTFWGSFTSDERPKPKILPNGDRSPEDLILNPKNPNVLQQTPRAYSNARILQKLFTSLGFTGKRRINCSPTAAERKSNREIITQPQWKDSTTELLRKSFRLQASKKPKLRKKGLKLFLSLKEKYTDMDFTRAVYRVKEERKEFPYTSALTLRSWNDLRSDPLLKLYGITIPMPSIKR